MFDELRQQTIKSKIKIKVVPHMHDVQTFQVQVSLECRIFIGKAKEQNPKESFLVLLFGWDETQFPFRKRKALTPSQKAGKKTPTKT